MLDLTESNPTRVGLTSVGAETRAALAAAGAAEYDPDPLGSLSARQAVAAYYEQRGVTVAPAHLSLTAGTSEAYAHLFRLLSEPGDVVLAPRPSYPLFEPLAALEGTRLEHYPLAYDRRWYLDLGSLEQTCGPRARALILVQPNNPTGCCLDAAELEEIEALCERRGMALIADEVFGDFPRPPITRPLPSLLGPRRVPTFVLGGISKCCGLPQMKLGWIAVAGPERERQEAVRGLEWIADLFLSVGPAQQALPWLLEERHGFQARTRERLAINLERIDGLARRCPQAAALPWQGGWQQVLRLPATRSDEDWTIALLERDVLVHPGHFYDFAEDSMLVVSLLPRPEDFDRGVERLEELLEG